MSLGRLWLIRCMSVKWSWWGNLSRWDFFLQNALYVAWHTKISAALHKTVVRSKYANSVSQFLLYWLQIICWQLKAFLPSLFHLCACEMSPGWGHLITWMDPIVGHLNSILVRLGGNLNNNFQKSQMPGGLLGGGGDDVEALMWSIHSYIYSPGKVFKKMRYGLKYSGTRLLSTEN